MRKVKTKRKPKEKYLLSDKQLEKVKQSATDKALNYAVLLVLSATADEIGMDEETLCKVWDRMQRYSERIEEKLVRIELMQKTIEKHTGAKLKGLKV